MEKELHANEQKEKTKDQTTVFEQIQLFEIERGHHAEVLKPSVQKKTI